MKFIKLFHNPGAGEGAHSEEKLLEKIKNAGFDCSYSSTKDKISETRIPNETDFIAVAGGDGSVRKLASYLLNKKVLEKPLPIALLPCGTANNIAHTLGIEGSSEEIIERWKNENFKSIDVGNITGIKDADFFVEAIGFGVFPRLMKEMKNRLVKSDDPKKELHEALEILLTIVDLYKPRFCKLTLDGVEYSGNYLMVEIMNIRSIGPNLNIAPEADPADGKFDVVMIPEWKRDELKTYVENRLMHGKEEAFLFETLTAKKIEVEWGGRLIHVDDQLLKSEQSITIEMVPTALSFLV